MTTIEFCFRGVEETKKAYDILQKDTTIDVIAYGCLSNCETCRTTPYAKISQEIITGVDANDLIKKIYSKISQQPDDK